MKQAELIKLSDQELLIESKKMKSTSTINAVLIGFLFGIIIFSILKSSVGLVTLIPLFFIYKIVNNSKKDDDDLKLVLKERNLS